MPTLPTKLKNDAISEAVFEIRFDLGNAIPEIAVGRLADSDKWPKFVVTRLPFADLPQQLRIASPSLIYQPLFELKLRDDNSRIIKVGTQTVICAVTKPYPGWDEFNRLHILAINNLFDAIPDVTVRRLGLRYINALNTELHHVAAISDLQLGVSVGGENLTTNYNLNFRVPGNETTECLIRVATKDFAMPPLDGPEHTLIDIDTYTPSSIQMHSKNEIIEWLRNAHEIKNRAFFNLFSSEQIEVMREK